MPIVIPLLLPRSVIDLGCGTGGWLAIMREHGIEEVLGVDGDYIDRSQLLIPTERFVAADLRQPFSLKRQFDLVLCIEVAEHLPGASASTLVKTITDLGPVVLFSAAIPFQGGNGHINEQWPDYWRELFAAQGFVLVDCLRRQLWDDPDIQPYVAQNLMLYAAQDRLGQSAALRKALAESADFPLRLVHPGVFQTPSAGRLLGLWRHARKRTGG